MSEIDEIKWRKVTGRLKWRAVAPDSAILLVYPRQDGGYAVEVQSGSARYRPNLPKINLLTSAQSWAVDAWKYLCLSGTTATLPEDEIDTSPATPEEEAWGERLVREGR